MCLIVVADAVYETVRRLTRADASGAYANAVKVTNLESALGINAEVSTQQAVISNHVLVVAANYFYGLAYVIATVGVLAWLYLRHPNAYGWWRTALAVLTFVSLIGFIVFPLMPPRLVDQHGAATGLVDTLRAFPTPWTFDSSLVTALANQYAAMPSIHCAWAIWSGAALWCNARHRTTRAFAVAFPVATALTVLVTANHFVLDIIGAGLVVGIAVAAMKLIERQSGSPVRANRDESDHLDLIGASSTRDSSEPPTDTMPRGVGASVNDSRVG